MNTLAIRLSFLLLLISIHTQAQQDYWNYHKAVVKAEEFLAKEQFEDALNIYQALFENYDFIFLREYQVAAQLAVHVGDTEAAFQYIRKGIEGGWSMKYLKGTTYLNPLHDLPEWKQVKADYEQLRAKFIAKKNTEVGQQVQKMIKADQWLALKGLFTFSSNAQDRYGERKFAPHSEQQMQKLQAIMDEHGYPGEQLVGIGLWMATILSHHNSISAAYVQQDTIYEHLKPQLMEAVKTGALNPYKLAQIEDWRLAVKYQRQEAGYGYLNEVLAFRLTETNQLRQALALRSIELRNQLVDVEKKTGMYFFLMGQPWVKGHIEVIEN